MLWSQEEGQDILHEQIMQNKASQEGIQYLRFNPSLETEVDAGETDDNKLVDMLWTTRKYMASTGY